MALFMREITIHYRYYQKISVYKLLTTWAYRFIILRRSHLFNILFKNLTDYIFYMAVLRDFLKFINLYTCTKKLYIINQMKKILTYFSNIK